MAANIGPNGEPYPWGKIENTHCVGNIEALLHALVMKYDGYGSRAGYFAYRMFQMGKRGAHPNWD